MRASNIVFTAWLLCQRDVNWPPITTRDPPLTSRLLLIYTITNRATTGELEPSNADFSLPSKARSSLTNLLIVHPIAAFFTLICLFLSILCHLQGPAHSPSYLLALLILCLPTFLLSLLAFLVDILIFLPHLAWGGWVVLGATVLIAIAGIVTCGMRRTLVSKVARRKRIQDNAAMNGAEYYAQNPPTTVPPPSSSVNGVGVDKLPEFATFEVDKLSRGEPEGERIPLNPRSRTVSPPPPEDRMFGGASGFNGPSLRRAPSDRSDGYGPPQRGAGPLSRPGPPGQVRNQYSNGTLQGGNSGPYGPPQQRGYGGQPGNGYGPPTNGYGPPGNGYGPPGNGYGPQGNGYAGNRYSGEGPPGGYRGPSPANGPGMFNAAAGLTPSPRRGPMPGPGPGPGQFGPRGPPPPGAGGPYGGGGQYGMAPQGGMGPRGMGPDSGLGLQGGMMMGPGPGRRRSMPQPQPQQQQGYNYPDDEPVIDERREFEQTLPPAGGVGVATTTENDDYREPHREPSTAIGESLSREPTPPRLSVVNETQSHAPYEDNEYVPPRAAWNGETTGTPPPGRNETASPVELPAAEMIVSRATVLPRPSDSYYEDVSPAFDNTRLPNPHAHPAALTPGGTPMSAPLFPLQIPDQPMHHQHQHQHQHHQHHHHHQQTDAEALRDGQRSPAMSTTSNFTSISQRPLNPNWQPGYAPPMPAQRRGPTSSQLLGGNPDFELPGVGPRGRGGRGMGMGR